MKQSIKRLFQDQVVVITGASSGIGRTTAISLGRLNARLVLVSRNWEKLNSVKDHILEKGGRAIAIQADVSHPEDTERVARETLSQWGTIDILIACAGQYVQGSANQMDIGMFEQSLSVNFYGTLHMIRSVLPVMQQAQRGHIVIVNSLDSKKGIVGDAPYVAAKCALDGYGDVLRQELKDQHIGVTSIYPGRVDTPMLDHVRVPWTSGKIAPEKVARVILKGIRNNKAVMYVPAVYRPLLAVNMFMPRFADWCYKILKVEGERINL